MPRDLPIGNGNLLVCFDAAYALRDLYYPHVGADSHTTGHPCRTGVWVEGQFAWLDSPQWQKTLVYEPETLATRVTAVNESLKLVLVCQDLVDFDRDMLFRRFEITNMAGHQRQVRLFFHYSLDIWGSNVANTFYYHPYLNVLVAYKNRRYFVVSGKVGAHYGVHSWATGVSNFHGAEGTWRDAEDGELSRNPIAHGSVDGTIALHVDVPPGGSETVHHWLCVEQGYFEAETAEKFVRERGPEAFEQRTRDYWRLWVNQEARDFGGLPEGLVELYKRSLLIIRTQTDNRGAIIAANDSDVTEYARDTYSYMWPRDGALVAMALDRAGYHELARRFFQFCLQVVSPHGYFFHKYTAFGSLGSSWHPWIDAQGQPQLPIQEDETALVLIALQYHFKINQDVEVLRPFYRPLVRNGADFLLSYRDERTGLPAPSWDLWEERRGIHAWTVGTVWGGLRAAGDLTHAFGDLALAERYRTAAEEIKAATQAYLYDPGHGRFARAVRLEEGRVERDMTMDSSIIGLFLFDMFEPDDPMLAATMAQLRQRLRVNTSIGGLARYEGDHYQRVSQDLTQVPGNPWFICTLGLAIYDIATAERLEELQRPLEVLEWVRRHALPSGVLAEQVHPYTGAPLSVSPLTWSHAAFLDAVHRYVAKRRLLLRDRLQQGFQGDEPMLEALRTVVGDF